MPLYRFVCEACGLAVQKLLKPGEQTAARECTACSGALTRDRGTPSSQVMESLDNGAMVKRVERLQNAEELYRDRANQDPRQKSLHRLV